MDVKVKTEPRDLSKLPKKMQKKVQEKVKSALFRVAQIGINIILERTKEGRGYKGGAFKPYSEKYAAFRAEKNRTLRPNLTMSGKMLAAMTSKANHKQAEIFFRGKDESDKASGNNKSRPFFGFNRAEKKKLAKKFEGFMQ
jgi:formamidopyrimidine-DNA glycosylase